MTADELLQLRRPDGRYELVREHPPDVVFEVDRDIDEKTREWLRAGTRAVVTVDPHKRSASVHRPGAVTEAGELLEIPDVIPGWRLPLAELFA